MRGSLRALVLTASLLCLPLEGLALIRVGGLDTPGSQNDVEVVGGLAYVADGGSGLRVIDFGPEYIASAAPIPTLGAVGFAFCGLLIWLTAMRHLRHRRR